MKKLFIAVLMLAGLSGSAQTDRPFIVLPPEHIELQAPNQTGFDLLKVLGGPQDTLAAQRELLGRIQAIEANLQRAHEQYQVGTKMILCGATIALAGFVINSPQSGKIMGIAGGVMAAIGWAVQVDSHKLTVGPFGIAYKL